MLCSGVSQRRTALLLGTSAPTVARKLRFLARRKRAEHEAFLRELAPLPTALDDVQFDEMETHEHSKWKPLSIALLVSRERKILGFRVSRMPARGVDAAKALKKYGPRPDERKAALHSLFADLKPVLAQTLKFTSDQKPLYAPIVRAHFPAARHEQVKGKRGCITGQGELKKIGFDPLFALNHTAAMLRANISRLFRRTWCTTKNRHRLVDHLWLYAAFHNQVLTGKRRDILAPNHPPQPCKS